MGRRGGKIKGELSYRVERKKQTGEQSTKGNGYGLYDVKSTYTPGFHDAYYEVCREVYQEYFPENRLFTDTGDLYEQSCEKNPDTEEKEAAAGT